MILGVCIFTKKKSTPQIFVRFFLWGFLCWETLIFEDFQKYRSLHYYEPILSHNNNLEVLRY